MIYNKFQSSCLLNDFSHIPFSHGEEIWGGPFGKTFYYYSYCYLEKQEVFSSSLTSEEKWLSSKNFLLAFVDIPLPGQELCKEIELWQIYPTKICADVYICLFSAGTYYKSLFEENVSILRCSFRHCLLAVIGNGASMQLECSLDGSWMKWQRLNL